MSGRALGTLPENGTIFKDLLGDISDLWLTHGTCNVDAVSFLYVF